MGSFDYTCNISGLPIQAGDPVRFLMLTENPFYQPGAHTCYMHDIWVPRAFPLKAVYNDYGSVEGLEEDFSLNLWHLGLQRDLIEQGTGDNACLHVPTSKDMETEELLQALWEGRILVKGLETVEERAEVMKGLMPELHPGVPTMARVKEVIEKAGLPLAEEYPSEGFLVDLYPNQFVRVRWSGENQILKLSEFQPHLGSFATVVTTGSGSYSDPAELLVAPKPLPGGEHYNVLFHKEESRNLHVVQAMVREDVWQVLLEMRFQNWNKKIPPDYPSWRKLADDFWQAIKGITEEEGAIPTWLRMEHLQRENPVAAFLKDEGFVTGLGTHLEIALKENPEGEELEKFLDSVAEMAFIQYILMQIRHQWRAGTSCGPQWGEWAMHKEYLEKLIALVPPEEPSEDL